MTQTESIRELYGKNQVKTHKIAVNNRAKTQGVA